MFFFSSQSKHWINITNENQSFKLQNHIRTIYVYIYNLTHTYKISITSTYEYITNTERRKVSLKHRTYCQQCENRPRDCTSSQQATWLVSVCTYVTQAVWRDLVNSVGLFTCLLNYFLQLKLSSHIFSQIYLFILLSYWKIICSID